MATSNVNINVVVVLVIVVVAPLVLHLCICICRHSCVRKKEIEQREHYNAYICNAVRAFCRSVKNFNFTLKNTNKGTTKRLIVSRGTKSVRRREGRGEEDLWEQKNVYCECCRC